MSDFLVSFLPLLVGGLLGSAAGSYLAAKRGTSTEATLVRELRVVDAQPGDRIILTLGDRGVSYASEATIERISSQIRAVFPDNQVIVLESDMGLSLVRRGGSVSTGKAATRSITIPFPDRRVGA
jgi:hypothetical protein